MCAVTCSIFTHSTLSPRRHLHNCNFFVCFWWMWYRISYGKFQRLV